MSISLTDAITARSMPTQADVEHAMVAFRATWQAFKARIAAAPDPRNVPGAQALLDRCTQTLDRLADMMDVVCPQADGVPWRETLRPQYIGLGEMGMITFPVKRH